MNFIKRLFNFTPIVSEREQPTLQPEPRPMSERWRVICSVCPRCPLTYHHCLYHNPTLLEEEYDELSVCGFCGEFKVVALVEGDKKKAAPPRIIEIYKRSKYKLFRKNLKSLSPASSMTKDNPDMYRDHLAGDYYRVVRYCLKHGPPDPIPFYTDYGDRYEYLRTTGSNSVCRICGESTSHYLAYVEAFNGEPRHGRNRYAASITLLGKIE